MRIYLNSSSFIDGVSRQPNFRRIRAVRKRIYKMIIKKKSQVITVVFSIFISVVLAGCTKNSEPDVVKTGNINQTIPASNNSNSVSANISIPANNSFPANNNVSANQPKMQVTAVEDKTPTTIDSKDKQTSTAAKEPVPQIGSGGSDLVLFTQARNALNVDPELINSVIIEIKEGNVTLNGSVTSAAQKAKAGQLVQSVKGIKSVKNNLRVGS